MTTFELVQYYIDLLILQYNQKPKAAGTIEAVVTPLIMPQTSVQVITFSAVPTSGHFVPTYDGTLSIMSWDDTASTFQTELRLIAGLENVTVSGDYSVGFTITFVGVPPVASVLVIGGNTLLASSTPVVVTVNETDLTLPLAVQDGFNLFGPNIASGVQLDVIGKYAGVSRTGQGFTQQITLNDSDFLSLIQMAIVQNSAGSSLSDIQNLLFQFFPGQILVFDYQNMQMSYLISSSVGSPDLVQLFITEGLLPKPMAVGVGVVIYAPIINMFFGFRTYELPAFNVTPFNTYEDYHTDWPWLSYADAVPV